MIEVSWGAIGESDHGGDFFLLALCPPSLHHSIFLESRLIQTKTELQYPRFDNRTGTGQACLTRMRRPSTLTIPLGISSITLLGKLDFSERVPGGCWLRCLFPFSRNALSSLLVPTTLLADNRHFGTIHSRWTGSVRLGPP